MKVRRIFVEKKPGFDVEAKKLLKELKEGLKIQNVDDLRILNRYDVENICDEDFAQAKNTIFSEKTVDFIYDEEIKINEGCRVFAFEYLPGQYDQRADSAGKCIKILNEETDSIVKYAKVILIYGNISNSEFEKIKAFCINPVDSREACLNKPESLVFRYSVPYEVETINDFIYMSNEEIQSFLLNNNLAMSFEDLKFCQEYFRSTEKRNPTITEIKVIDTYWSDHCRHTTFNTSVEDVKIEDGLYTNPIKNAYREYLNSRKFVYKDKKKNISLMDLATIGMKELKKRGFLDDLDESDENNACTVNIDVDVDGRVEKWLLLFKNETHNHPTEIEPFGGAATCLGGAIRDPLSGRAYVYQAMRVTGSADPRRPIDETLKGKLPQRVITTKASDGYSSYGNQIGLTTGHVEEVYHEDYVAKRMEIGAVIGAVPKENVVRKTPEASDVIILLGGRTGRDGCGGATGSSKKHTEKSIVNCGAEVQKGNALIERAIQRLFRKSEVSRMIKKCNDFGAGGVCVAIGELADGLNINLNLVTKKYEGLDGTELAISESQERMAVVVSKKDSERFISLALEENLEATAVATVTDNNRLIMEWNGKAIVDISRDFLNTNGVTQKAEVFVKAPKDQSYFDNNIEIKDLKASWLNILGDLNCCSKKGLVEKFDSTIGAGTVIMPFGGKLQRTFEDVMAAKIPVLNGNTTTVSLMSFGFNPNLSKWSPFHGALYAVVESVSKIVAAGGDYKKVRLTFQEYFERLEKEPERWGKPFSSLLGALHAQRELNIPSIGGKDSMSGSFNDINVPPTLVSFAVNTAHIKDIVSRDLKGEGHLLILLKSNIGKDGIVDFNELKDNFSKVNELIKSGLILSSSTIKYGGICASLSSMAFGNNVGVYIDGDFKEDELFTPFYGSFILEALDNEKTKKTIEKMNLKVIGRTIKDANIRYKDTVISLDEAYKAYSNTLEDVFKTKTDIVNLNIKNVFSDFKIKKFSTIKNARPRVFIPVFPGTNCEYDCARAFEKEGGKAETFIFKNLNSCLIKESTDEMARRIKNSNIIMIPGGFSAGDEPEGSGKFISNVFRNPKIKEAVNEFLLRDGLILGICNGFQALIKLGLLPFGEIRDIDEDSPTLTYNKIGRHVSTVTYTKIVSNKSPWFNCVNIGDVYAMPVSHGEGRFIAKEDVILNLIKNGQVATQYVDFDGNATYDIRFNPNGSYYAVEGITSPDGRILGKMGHSERITDDNLINIYGNKNQMLFKSGIEYFK
jgi:phosphoribosylformylglycinamidine synthase